MLSDLLWILAAVGALFWVVLPAGILIMAVVYRDEDRHRERAALGDPPAEFGGNAR